MLLPTGQIRSVGSQTAIPAQEPWVVGRLCVEEAAVDGDGVAGVPD